MGNTINKVIYLILPLIILCGKQIDVSAAELVSSDKKFPITLPTMTGWHGLKIVKSKAYNQNQPQCDVIFPKNFGLESEERDFLSYFISHDRQIRTQANCDTILIVYKVLAQLRLLATQKQDKDAARLLLYEGTSDMPFNLDGEVAETYTATYLLPVLEKFKMLNAVLDEKIVEVVANNICAEISWRQDVHDAKMISRINKMIAHLPSAGAKSLKTKIHYNCYEH